MLVDTILFDYDGVVMNTDDFNRQSLSYACERHGLAFTERDFLSFFAGRRLKDGARAFLEQHASTEIADTFMAAKYAFDVRYLDVAFPYPDAIEFIEHNRGRVIMGLVSGSRRTLIERFCCRFPHIASCFATMIAGEDVSSGKPSPDPYCLAIARLGATRGRTLAIEDSPPGIEAAHAAGLHCLAVLHTHTPAQLSEADWTVASLADPRLTLNRPRASQRQVDPLAFDVLPPVEHPHWADGQ